MVIKLFILGLPGCGKSTVARYVNQYIQNHYRHLKMQCINDYDILYKMFKADIEGKFRPSSHDGFDVIDLSVCDIALIEIKRKALEFLQNERDTDLIVIEFARNDYGAAFQIFGRDFLQSSYFLFLDTEIDICRERIQYRVTHQSTTDDHFVSDYIFDAYYNQENSHHLPPNFKTDYGISEQQIKIIENNKQFEDIRDQIDEFIYLITRKQR